MLNIYLLEQSVNNEYDTYDSCVVIAESESEAKTFHPYYGIGKCEEYHDDFISSDWVSRKDVNVTVIGVAAPNESKRVVCASFNAG